MGQPTTTRDQPAADIREEIAHKLAQADVATTAHRRNELRNMAEGMALTLQWMLRDPRISALDNGSIADSGLLSAAARDTAPAMLRQLSVPVRDPAEEYEAEPDREQADAEHAAEGNQPPDVEPWVKVGETTDGRPITTPPLRADARGDMLRRFALVFGAERAHYVADVIVEVIRLEIAEALAELERLRVSVMRQG